VILAGFGLAWWQSRPDTGGPNEGQRLGLALGYCVIGMLVFIPPLSFRKVHELTAQRTLIVSLAIFMTVALWWVGFVPEDVMGCSRAPESPDCHTTQLTRWRALREVTGAWAIAFLVTHALGSVIARVQNPEEATR
jgi:hypothetical protein